MVKNSQEPRFNQSRRNFCRTLSFAGGATLLSHAGAAIWLGRSNIANGNSTARGNAAESATPHFLLHIVVEQGWSPTYLFDARPRTFTSAQLWENYHDSSSETLSWTDKKGRTSWVSPSMKPLAADFLEQPCFSVIKGLHGSADFDGHRENQMLLLSGSTAGGAYLGVNLNQGSRVANSGVGQTPLDYLALGQSVFGSGLRGGTSLPLSLTLAQALRAMSDESGIPSATAVHAKQIIGKTFATAGQSNGLGGNGARQFAVASSQTASIKEALAKLDISGLSDGSKSKQRIFDDVALALRAFNSGIGRTALVGFPSFNLQIDGVRPPSIDCHDGESASAQPAVYKYIAEQLAGVFRLLRTTPFDAQQSLSFLDVTTVLVTSEFGRTNRQPDKAIDKTGTDHNRFGGLALVGGKGIEPGLFVGSTDLDQLITKNDSQGTKDFAPPSLAHDRFDPAHLMAMGHVYDFAAGTSVPSARPESYKQGDYLTSGSLVNSIYSIFGMPDSSWRAQAGLGGSVGERFKVINEIIKKA